jgi:uncharacterized protein YqhQ
VSLTWDITVLELLVLNQIVVQFAEIISKSVPKNVIMGMLLGVLKVVLLILTIFVWDLLEVNHLVY